MMCRCENTAYEILDQTYGVVCLDCRTILGYDWGDDFIDDELIARTPPRDFFRKDHVCDPQCIVERCIVERVRRLWKGT